VQQTPPETDLTTFHRIRVVIAQGALVTNPDYATIAVYDLDTAQRSMRHAPATAGRLRVMRPHPGVTIVQQLRVVLVAAEGIVTVSLFAQPMARNSVVHHRELRPERRLQQLQSPRANRRHCQGGFTIGTFTGSRTSQTDFEVEYFRVLMYSAVNDATTQIHRAQLTSDAPAFLRT